MNPPLNTRITAWLVKKFLGLFEFESLVVYADDNSPYKFVLMQGDPMSTTLGLCIMIRNLANATGKSEQEVVKLIFQNDPTRVA